MKKTIFAVSDIHGDFKALKEGLDKAGYDENNPQHLLVSVGDAFDRGSEVLAVYEYLKRLSDEGKAVVIKGNHTCMFIDYLNGDCTDPFNYLRNGTDETLADFLGRSKPFESWCAIDKNIKDPTFGDFARWIEEARKEINNDYPELLDWLNSRPYYLETDKYIFTHGAIDTRAEDWHNPRCVRYNFLDWEALMWDDGTFFGKKINNTDKTIVIGHFSTGHLRSMYNIPYAKGEKHSILKREDGRVIAIDACTTLTHEVNVLVIEDEEMLEGKM